MKRFKNILYVYQANIPQESSIERAVLIAENNQATLTIIEVVPKITAGIGLSPGEPFNNDLQSVLLAKHHEALQTTFSRYENRINFQLNVTSGTLFLEVIRAVLRNNHDLVIKPAENPDWIDRLFGSDDMHLLRKCPCPVWLMKPEKHGNYKCVVAAVDFDLIDQESEEQTLNQEIIKLSTSIALSDLAEWHLLHTWDAPEAEFIKLWTENPINAYSEIIEGEHIRHQNAMESTKHQLYSLLGRETYDYLKPHFHLQQGSAIINIPQLVKDLHADLVVMGTVARTGIAGFFIGNTAEAILSQLDCSVLAIKPPGFKSPIQLESSQHNT